MDAEPDLPSLVAVTWAIPAATAVTTPLALTVAIPVVPLDHVTVLPVRILLFASRVVAVSCEVPPTWRVKLAGEIDTDATGIGGGGGALDAVVVTATTFDSGPNTAS
jgi:hypothetical protein